MSLSHTLRIGALGALAIGFTVAVAPGCSSSDDHTHTGGTSGSTGGAGGSTGGAGGSTGGAGGATGGAGGATGGAGGGPVMPAFMNIPPCSSEADFKKVTSIKATAVLKYDPPCVQIKKGDMLSFDMNLEVHPLKKSTMRGMTANNPIVDTATGMSAKFTFPNSGFFGFYCSLHGGTDTGTGMAGVVWVTE